MPKFETRTRRIGLRNGNLAVWQLSHLEQGDLPVAPGSSATKFSMPVAEKPDRGPTEKGKDPEHGTSSSTLETAGPSCTFSGASNEIGKGGGRESILG